ncbi:hypothetical protein J2S10_004486 [Neobacillus ginsengisoli]|uniref:IS1182 family transposase n=1 Tax=Neobacillus ginsengisoli TaxID=904295 RepID=A0ABT9Y0E0_9BACI|nr:hypothetical protein [Neobacillus ginsengisoli]
MISNQDSLVLSPFMAIYDHVIPKDNMLRQINELVDFSFIREELKTKYCLDNGRNAVPPIRMFKYLLLKSIYDLSDVDVVERSKYDMSFKYFLDIAPEDSVNSPSSLTKFRKLRLKNVGLLDMLIGKTIEIALEKEIIKSKSIILDATHTKARYNQKATKKFLQEKSKNVRKAVYQIDESMKEKFSPKTTSNEVKDELKYCRQIISVVESEPQIAAIPAVKEKLNVLKEVVEDYTVQLNYSADPDARVGHKTADSSFFGYKTHIDMSEERIITAAVVTTGEKSDGKYLQELIEKSQITGMEIDTIIGDTAYSEKENIRYTRIKYLFDIKKCKVCPFREGCYKEGAKSKSYSITIKSTEHLDQEAFQNTEAFNELAKTRYKIEAKNSELKNRHGYDTAAGLLGMEIQGATCLHGPVFPKNSRIADYLIEKAYERKTGRMLEPLNDEIENKTNQTVWERFRHSKQTKYKNEA